MSADASIEPEPISLAARLRSLACWALFAAGVAEVAVGLFNRINLLSFALGGLALAAAVASQRQARIGPFFWTMAIIGGLFAFRVFVYQAPTLAIVFVAASGAMFIATLVLAAAARRWKGIEPVGEIAGD